MYSKEHINYLKKLKKETIIIHISRLVILLSFIFLWQFLSDKKIINPFVFSSPKKIIETIINLYNQKNLFNHIWITFYETIISFLIGTILGITIATILWFNKYLSKVLEPFLTVINSLPKIALGPIIIIWVGASMKSIIAMALLISLITTILNVYQGFNETDINKIKLLKSLKASKFQLFRYLIFPGNLKNIICTLKINISMTLVGIIMGEFLVSKEGIGYLIMYGSQIFNLNLVMAGIIILSIYAIILYYIVNLLEKKS